MMVTKAFQSDVYDETGRVLPARSVADHVAPAFEAGFGMSAYREATRILAETEPETVIGRQGFHHDGCWCSDCCRRGYLAWDILAESLARAIEGGKFDA